MERRRGSTCQRRHGNRAWTKLLHVILFLFLGLAGHLDSRSWAQAECGVSIATPIRVENATGVDMLRAAATCADGGLLEADWAGTVPLDFPIVVESGVSLSITGEDTQAEVLGVSHTRLFEVSPGGELVLTQLRLSGGTADDGGAIYSNLSALVLDSCTFHGNVATKGNGGGVWAEGGTVSILGGEFSGNKATGYGGAVAAVGAGQSLVAEGRSMFKGNTASVGGALYCSGVAGSSPATSCSLRDIEFTSNIATYETEGAGGFDFSEGVDGGGAVVFEFANAKVTDSVFVGNHAKHSGGALLGENGTNITVNGCKFENNTAEMFGGAIAAASMTLGGSTQLINNTATLDGGAVSTTR